MSNIVEALKDKFEKAEKLQNGPATDRMHIMRKHAMQQFEIQGIPGKKSEAYKYTDLGKTLSRFENAPVLETGKISTELTSEFPIEKANLLVFINGKYSSEHSNILSNENELKITPLQDVLTDDSANEHYGAYANDEQDPFVALNTAFASGGVLIEFKKNQKPLPVILQHVIDTTREEGTSYSRNLILAEEFSEAVVMEAFEATGTHDYLHNSVSEVFLAVNAKVQWHKIQNVAAASQIDQIAVHQSNASRFDLTTLTTEGKVIRNNVRIAVDGEGCETHLYGLYLVNGKSHIDNQTSVDHIKPHSVSNELYKGILDDSSHGVFNGKVYVRREAQKTNAFQSNKNILLSDNATINTKPQLEIWADDVKCSHGCTTGQIDEEALFYLRSRGLSENSARRLMLLAFAIDTMNGVEREDIKKFLEEQIIAKLDS